MPRDTLKHHGERLMCAIYDAAQLTRRVYLKAGVPQYIAWHVMALSVVHGVIVSGSLSALYVGVLVVATHIASVCCGAAVGVGSDRGTEICVYAVR